METHFQAMESAKADVTREKLKDDIRGLTEDAEALLKATAGDVSEKVKETRSRLASAIERVKASTEDMEKRAAEAAKVADKVVREHPYESIGIAFGLGLLIGVLVARR
ncbi:MAG: DUF883 family protein [Verrucomicrobiota bacterium]|nr:DUF883 family protein [Verrucomicrobiota bacterium]